MILTWRWWGYSLEGGTPLYKLYRYVPPHRVGFLHHFAGIRCGFRGDYRSVWTYLSFQFQMSKKEREICEFKGDFCLRSNLVMITLYLSKGQAWQRVWILEVWSENRSGKLHFLAWNRIRIWRTRWHTPTKNSQEYPPPSTSPRHNKVLSRKGLSKYVCYKEVSLYIKVLFLRCYFNWGEKH